jgi:hypothetical protein
MSLQAVIVFLFVSITPVLACSTTSHILTQQPQHDICHGPLEVYLVKPSHGKGLGVFAAHDLEIGDIIMRETPMIKIQPPKVAKGNPYPMSTISSLVREQFEVLQPEMQDDILSLTFHESTVEKANADKLGAIFRTNAYNSGAQIGLFPRIARINHSCRPNLSYYWNEKLNKRIVYATRPIKKGEEVFVSYIPLLLTHEERQKHLDRYGFKCHCEACSQERDTLKASDDRRVTISKAFADFEPQLVLTRPKSKAAIKQARNNAKASNQLAQLVQQEGLADYYAKAYKVAAINHARVGDWEPAAIWANRGYELRFREDPQSPATLEMHYLTSTFVSEWENELRNASQEHDKH